MEDAKTTQPMISELTELLKCIMDYYMFSSDTSFDKDMENELEKMIGTSDFSAPSIPEDINDSIKAAFLSQLKRFS